VSPPAAPPVVAPFIFGSSEMAAELAVDTLLAIPLLAVPLDIIALLLPIETAKDDPDNGCIVEVREW